MLTFLLRVAGEKAVACVHEELRHLELSNREAGVMITIDSRKLNQNQIAEILDTHPNAMIRIVDSLEKRGLLNRNQNPINRREYIIELTDSGRKLLPTVIKLVEKAQKTCVKNLSVTEREKLQALLQKVVEG
jgi:DNA-binding MarR family transcriptional regulator